MRVPSSRGRSAGCGAPGILTLILPATCVSRSRAEGLLWRVFPPHFLASSLSHPTVSYTVDGLTRNTFLKACVREYNCSNECMFDRFINF